MTLFRSLLGAVLLLLLLPAGAAVPPGFRIQTLVSADGFVSSVVVDSKGTVYFTTTNGWIHRIDQGQATKVVALPTRAGGNGGLLGMVLLDDRTAVVHYTTWIGTHVIDDVISRIDLVTGTETVLKAFPGDVEWPLRGVSDEHHGGNPTLGPDGSVFVGIGEYGGFTAAQKPDWNGGKLWKIDAQTGEATQWARGLRNPYDLAWDPRLERVVISDNGPDDGDELNVVAQGDNLGWPLTFGKQPPVEGMLAPRFTFDTTVAPTGLARLANNPLLTNGYLLGAFVTRSIYYFPSLTEPIATPLPVVDGFSQFVIDVTEGPDGAIYFATAMGAASSIHRLHTPRPGDCNGDELTDWRDIVALVQELDDGDEQAMTAAAGGTFAGTWACDANGDRVIDDEDLAALLRLLGGRRRVVR